MFRTPSVPAGARDTSLGKGIMLAPAGRVGHTAGQLKQSSAANRITPWGPPVKRSHRRCRSPARRAPL